MRRALASLACIAAALCGCLPVDARPVYIDYQVPVPAVALDFGDVGTVMPAVACAPGDTACADAAPLAPPGAVLDCDRASSTCVARVDARLVIKVDLSHESSFAPLTGSGATPPGVSIEALHYHVDLNTVSADLPEVALYVGTASVSSEEDPAAHRLAVLPALGAGAVPACAPACAATLDKRGRSALEAVVADFAAPFHLIGVAHVLVRAGTPSPTGKLQLRIQPQVRLRFDFK